MVDKADERPGRFNMVADFSYMKKDDAIKLFGLMCEGEKWLSDDVIKVLKENVNGVEMKMTGAFISNLVENLKEIRKDYDEDGEELTCDMVRKFILSSYKGFYMNQSEEEKSTLGFKIGEK